MFDLNFNMGLTTLTFLKLGTIIILFLYVIFSAIVYKQVNLMTETLEVDFEKPIKFVAFIHVLASIVLFFYALFV